MSLQRAFGTDVDILRRDPKALAHYLNLNNLAARDELSEVMAEYGWKEWRDDFGIMTDEGEERAKEELVDVLHFCANIAIALGMTDDELNAKYTDKVAENRRRQMEFE